MLSPVPERRFPSPRSTLVFPPLGLGLRVLPFLFRFPRFLVLAYFLFFHRVSFDESRRLRARSRVLASKVGVSSTQKCRVFSMKVDVKVRQPECFGTLGGF